MGTQTDSLVELDYAWRVLTEQEKEEVNKGLELIKRLTKDEE